MQPPFEDRLSNEVTDFVMSNALYEDKKLSYFLRRLIVELNSPQSIIGHYLEPLDFYQVQRVDKHTVRYDWYQDGEIDFELTISLSKNIRDNYISSYCRVYGDMSWGETKEEVEARYEKAMERVQSYLNWYSSNDIEFEVTPIGFKVYLRQNCLAYNSYLKLLCGLFTLLIPFIYSDDDLYNNNPKLKSVIYNDLIELIGEEALPF